jgi:hypothetical protein
MGRKSSIKVDLNERVHIALDPAHSVLYEQEVNNPAVHVSVELNPGLVAAAPTQLDV